MPFFVGCLWRNDLQLHRANLVHFEFRGRVKAFAKNPLLPLA